MEKLFKKDFGVARNDLELREIFENNSEYHPAYLNISCATNKETIKQRLETFWAQYQEYADENFLKEIRKHFFHQRAWEMYLSCVFLEKEICLLPRKERLKRGGGPDIQIRRGIRDIWVEAVTPSSGEGKDAVPKVRYNGVFDFPENQILLRITNSFEEKLNAYKKWIRNGVIKKNDNYILAINLGGIGHPIFDPGIPLILKPLFGVENLRIPIKNRIKGSPFWGKREKIYKKSGSGIEVDWFEEKEFSVVSGVISSNYNILDSPIQKGEMGNNLIISYNHNAVSSLAEDLLKFGSHYRKEGNRIKNIAEFIKG